MSNGQRPVKNFPNFKDLAHPTSTRWEIKTGTPYMVSTCAEHICGKPNATESLPSKPETNTRKRKIPLSRIDYLITS